MVAAAMAFDGFHQLLHAAEDLFANLLRILLFAGVRHFDAELVHFPDERFGRADAVFQPAPSDEGDGVHERARRVAQQHPVDREVDVGLHAGGVGEDRVEAQGGFAVEQLPCPVRIGDSPVEIMDQPGNIVGVEHLFEAFDGAFGDRAHRIDLPGVHEPLEEMAVGHAPREFPE